MSAIDRPTAPNRFDRQRVVIAVLAVAVLALSGLLFLGADGDDETPDPTIPATDVVGETQDGGDDRATQDGNP